jgi:hypothetical protein
MVFPNSKKSTDGIGNGRRESPAKILIGGGKIFDSVSDMKTPMVALGTALLGIAVGFVAGNSNSSHPESRAALDDAAPRTSSARRASGTQESGKAAEGITAGVLKGRDFTKLSAVEAFALVKADSEAGWGGGDPLESARKNYEFQLLLSKLPINVMEQVLKLSKEAGGPNYRGRQIFAAYAARDLEKALNWASTQPDADSWKNTAIGATAAHDPARAEEMFQEAMLKGGFNQFSGGSMEAGFNLASNYAKQGKDALLKFIDSVPSSSVSNLISNSARNLPKEDLPAFIDEVAQRVKDGKVDEWSLGGLLQNLASTDPALAMSWIAKMEPGPQRTAREVSVAGTLFQQGKAEDAMSLVKSAMAQDPGKEKEFVINQTSNMMYNNSEFAVQVAELLPTGSELTKDDVTKISSRYGRVDVVNMSKLIKSPDERAAYLEEAFTKMGENSKLNDTDYRILTYRLDSLGLTGDAATRVQQALTASRQKSLNK